MDWASRWYETLTGVLILRMYALWNQSKRIAWIFGSALFVAAVGGLIYVSAESLKFQICKFMWYLNLEQCNNMWWIDGRTPSPSAFPGCFLVVADRQVWIGLVVVLLFEAGRSLLSEQWNTTNTSCVITIAIVFTSLYKVIRAWPGENRSRGRVRLTNK